jgi:hypothetical protein
VKLDELPEISHTSDRVQLELLCQFRSNRDRICSLAGGNNSLDSAGNVGMLVKIEVLRRNLRLEETGAFLIIVEPGCQERLFRVLVIGRPDFDLLVVAHQDLHFAAKSSRALLTGFDSRAFSLCSRWFSSSSV